MAETPKPEPKMVRFILTSNRYWHGKYITAAPDAPVEVMLPETTKEDHFLRKAAEGKTLAEEAVKLQPHYAVKNPLAGIPTRPVEPGHQEKEPAPAETREAGKKKDRSL